MQVFKARLSKIIDENVFRGKWRDRSGVVGVLFHFDGTELTVVHGGIRWESGNAPGSGGFFNVLQIAVHDVERDARYSIAKKSPT